MPASRCPYFSLNVRAIPVPGHISPLRVPLCRCALTETLVDRLQAHVEGNVLAFYMQGVALDGEPRPIVGSDLQPIGPLTCTHERCENRCKPGFAEILTGFGLDLGLPSEK